MNAAAVIASIVAGACIYFYHRGQLAWRDNKISKLEEMYKDTESRLRKVERQYISYVMSKQTERAQRMFEQLEEDFSGMDDDMLREELQKAMENGNSERVDNLLDELNNRG